MKKIIIAALVLIPVLLFAATSFFGGSIAFLGSVDVESVELSTEELMQLQRFD